MRVTLKPILSSSDKRVARQTFWLNVISVVRLLGGLAQISITARMLGVEGYGALVAIIAFCALIHGIIAIPSGDTVSTFVTRSISAGRNDEASRIVRLAMAASFGISIVAYAVIAALILIAANYLGAVDDAYSNTVLLFGVVGILGSTSSESLAVLRLADRVALGSIVALVSVLARVGALGVAWYVGGGLTEVVCVYIVGSAVNGLGMFVMAAASSRRAGVEGFLRSTSVRVPADVLRFGIGSFGKSALGSANTHLDALLIAQLGGIADVGVYRAARRTVDFARQPFKRLSVGIKVELSRLWYSGDISGLRRILFRYTAVSVILSIVGFTLLAYFHESIVVMVFGSEFGAVATPLLIMIVGSTIVAGVAPLISLPPATGRISPTVVAESAGLITSVVAILLLVPSYATQGAAWANTIKLVTVAAVLAPYVYSMLRRNCEQDVTPRAGRAAGVNP